ncbi:MAG: hypothetical protein M5U09_07180 [Gammaproteobacteria bacterium]|nr:hypothetical protein [Gammaproteobacteria bacterium]
MIRKDRSIHQLHRQNCPDRGSISSLDWHKDGQPWRRKEWRYDAGAPHRLDTLTVRGESGEPLRVLDYDHDRHGNVREVLANGELERAMVFDRGNRLLKVTTPRQQRRHHAGLAVQLRPRPAAHQPHRRRRHRHLLHQPQLRDHPHRQRRASSHPLPRHRRCAESLLHRHQRRERSDPLPLPRRRLPRPRLPLLRYRPARLNAPGYRRRRARARAHEPRTVGRTLPPRRAEQLPPRLHRPGTRPQNRPRLPQRPLLRRRGTTVPQHRPRRRVRQPPTSTHPPTPSPTAILRAGIRSGG